MLKFDNVRFQYEVEDFSIIDHLSFEVQERRVCICYWRLRMWKKDTIFRLVNKASYTSFRSDPC